MGGSIASSMKEVQKEAQEKMIEAQKENMIKSQDRMVKLQMASAMAFSRDLMLWLGGASATIITGFTLAKIAGRNPPRTALFPAIGLGVAALYQYDMGYGTKAERISKYRQEILNDPKYDFMKTPIEEEKKEK